MFVESIEAQLFISVTDRQFAVSQELSSQQREPSLVRDDLRWNSLSEPIDKANKRFEDHLGSISQDGLRLNKGVKTEPADQCC